MTTIVNKYGGSFLKAENESEFLSERTMYSKKFKLPNGPNGERKFRIASSISPIHYKEDPFSTTEQLKEIDIDIATNNTNGWDYETTQNSWQFRYWQSLTVNSVNYQHVAQFRRGGKWIATAPVGLYWINANGDRELINGVANNITPSLDTENNQIVLAGLFGSGKHMAYEVKPDKFFKIVRITNKSDLTNPTISNPFLTVAFRIRWDNTTNLSNNFADGISSDFTNEDFGTPDETLINPNVFSQIDNRGDLWFWQKPEAWDSNNNKINTIWRILRKRNDIFILIGISATDANNATYPIFIDPAITEESIQAGADDIYYNTSGSLYNTTSSINYAGSNFDYRVSLLRFQTIPVPQGATINSSAVTFITRFATQGSNVKTRWKGVDEDDAGAFSDFATDSARARTTATVDWDDQTLSATTEYDSPDLSTIIDEIVARPGWSSGNNMIIEWGDSDERTTAGTNYQSFRTYEDSGNEARLNINYTEAATGSARNKILMVS